MLMSNVYLDKIMKDDGERFSNSKYIMSRKCSQSLLHHDHHPLHFIINDE